MEKAETAYHDGEGMVVASGVGTYSMLSMGSVGTREILQVPLQAVKGKQAYKADGLLEVILTDSTRR
ncbi:hypothetical protein [Paenibacillus lautus]|uniref:hypothetical protein n=1 Tax=Paenibacillus lautus TaxID=1401 RepID=UPI0039889D59